MTKAAGRRRSTTLTILLTALATGALVLLALNFTAGEKKVQQQVTRLYSTASPQFERALGSLLGPGIVGGNQVTELLNGDQIFPPMLAAIKAAQKSVTFETYIYWSGDIGKAFADALSERARAGVPVHVLLDWVGSSKMEESYLTEMREAGVQIEKFHKPHWYNLARMNNRTHRKLLVVDGQVGFTGGVGIAPLDGQRPRPRPLARLALPGARPRGGADAGHFSGQLAQGHRQGAAWRAVFPAHCARGCAKGANVLQLAIERQREHAAHVPPGHHGGRAQH